MKHLVSVLSGRRLDVAVCLAIGGSLEAPTQNRGALWRLPPEGPLYGHERSFIALVQGFGPPKVEDVFVIPPPHFSSDWKHGGPIIERERIALVPMYGPAEPAGTFAAMTAGLVLTWHRGDTMLVAAMRAFVASKFGAEVDLP